MNDFNKFNSDSNTYGFFWIFLNSLLSVGVFAGCHGLLGLTEPVALAITVIVTILLSVGFTKLIVGAINDPFMAVWQALWQTSDSANQIETPRPNQLAHGREIATSMIQQINKLADATQTDQAAPKTVANLATTTVVSAPVEVKTINDQGSLLELMPLPVIALDATDKIVLLNKVAADFIGKNPEEVIGRPVNDVLQISFLGKDTFENWLATAKASLVTASSSWDRVRMQLPDDGGVKQFDLMAHYTKNNSSGYETLLAIFDHTERYANEDSSTSYVAMAVHELRTPLTVLRGYIEVFEDELDGQLTPELRDFMHKMSASAQTLTAFVSNILNVARVDENQLTLSLHEANWNELLATICKDIELRAKVRGKTLELDLQTNLPTVAVDKVSIYEVVSNIIDNAIKYSGDSAKIIVHAGIGKDGSVETTIQDFGLGIPESSLKYLFTKYYRSHRSKSSVSGSGLGLYLVKAIVTAHGGNVWVNTKEGEGSTFGFSLEPYAKVAANLKDAPGSNIERQAYGWIKNHSMYRR